ncbi:helix-turn-helix domain-containing protein, partial [Patescibacteria group bacterium]|nr:helix-turn-helix domain-containing protein [Patescibacteria group bacterium]
MTNHSATRDELLSLLEQAIKEECDKEVIERLQWMIHYAEHKSASATCRRFGIARSTFYRWFNRFDPDDYNSLSDKPTVNNRPTFARCGEATVGRQSTIDNRQRNQNEQRATRNEQLATRNEQRNLTFTRTTAMLIALLLINIGVLLFVVPTLASAASSWRPTLLVNTEAFQIIDDDDTASDISLRFGDTLDERITYNRSSERFEFTGDQLVRGNLFSTGAIAASGSITAEGTLSGAALHVSGETTLSGAVFIEGAAAFDSTVTLNGITYTFPESDGDNTHVLTTNGAGTLSWAAAAGGISQTDGDNRYVNVSGDTMTGGLLITSQANKTDTAESELEVHGTMSGKMVSVTPSVASETGALYVKINPTIGTGAFIDSISNTGAALVIGARGQTQAPHILFGYDGTFDTKLYRSAANTLKTNAHILPETTETYDLGSDTLRWRDIYLSGGTLHMGDNSDESEISFDPLIGAITLDPDDDGVAEFVFDDSGYLGIGVAVPTTTLDVRGSMSGHSLHVRDSLSSSGTVSFETTVSFGDTIKLNGVTYTFPPSDGVSSGWVLKTDSSGTLSWAADSGGIEQSDADSRYVNQSGDTMTGNLVLQGKDLIASGAIITAKATVSGALTVEGVAQFDSTVTITEGALTDSTIVSADIKDGEVGAGDIGANAVQLSELDVSDVSDDIAGDIAEGELADSIVVSADIKDGTIAVGDLASADFGDWTCNGTTCVLDS